jgi:TatD DNase family protein
LGRSLVFIDAHCHINSDQLRADAGAVVRRAAEAGVRRMLLVGCDPPNSAEAVEMAREYAGSGVHAAVGVHPHEAKTVWPGELPSALLALAEGPHVVAVGETGLDYHYDHSPRDVQREVFKRHIRWAARVKKPLVIHIRSAESKDAMPDALRALEDASGSAALPVLMFHCYAGGLEYLNAMRDLSAYLSIGGPVTWPKSDELRAVAERVPEDRLLCETDAPWLTPKPYRGKLNEPAYVRFVYEEIAKIRGLSVEALCGIVEANAERLFAWDNGG